MRVSPGGLLSERWLRRQETGLVGFAAGALLAAAFLDVLPEAVSDIGPRALFLAFVGFVTFAILEWVLGQHHHRSGDRIGGAPLSLLPVSLLASDALHNVADGAAIAAAFLTSPRVGLMVAIAVVVHEVPQEVGDYSVLRASGLSRSRALLGLAGVQLTAAIGAVAVIAAAKRLRYMSAWALSIAGGTLLYIAATDLLPELHSGLTPLERQRRLVGFLVGLALIGATAIMGIR